MPCRNLGRTPLDLGGASLRTLLSLPASARYVVGLCGNLGFTHDPVIVFEAARLLRGNSDIHFLLSGWGVGFDQLREMHCGRGSPTSLSSVASKTNS